MRMEYFHGTVKREQNAPLVAINCGDLFLLLGIESVENLTLGQ